MSGEYRVIHFVPDPFIGSRIPIAAAVKVGDRLEIATCRHLPADSCVGGKQSGEVLRVILACLDQMRDFKELPVATGPHAVADIVRKLPAGVENPLQWVRSHVLPQSEATSERRQSKARNTKRASLGYRFFETWKIHDLVRKSYDPSEHWPSLAGNAGLSLPTISHWAGPTSDALLMEPIVPRRKFGDDVRLVSTNFAAYRYFSKRLSVQDGGWKLIAYLLPGCSRHEKESAQQALDATAHRIFDTDDARDREQFVEMIRERAQAAAVVAT
jgi:hypothetical protein